MLATHTSASLYGGNIMLNQNSLGMGCFFKYV